MTQEQRVAVAGRPSAERMPARESSEALPAVVVFGDLTVDWNLARRVPRRAGRGWHPDLGARACPQRGGAGILADLLTAALDADSGPAARVLGPDLAVERILPDDERLTHSYAAWAPFEAKRGEEHRVWRVDSPIGLDPATSDEASGEEWRRLEEQLAEADLVVLDDAGLGFRERSAAGLWRRLGETGRRPWVLLKVSRPVARGPLWEQLREHCAERLVVLMTIADLRGTDVQVSRELSWERTAQDLYWELVHNPLVSVLAGCAHVVVSFGAAGALLLSGRSAGGANDQEEGERQGRSRCSLLFDPEEIEGSWEAERPGDVIGATDCLAAAVARELLLEPEAPDLERAIGTGVRAGRRLWEEGYGGADEGMEVTFPFASVAGEIADGAAYLAQAPVEDPTSFLPQRRGAGSEADSQSETIGEAGSATVTSVGRAEGLWTILEDRYRGDLLGVAERVVRRGPEVALAAVPLGRFGKLLTVDRSEIESLRAVRALVGEYCHSSQPKPLSIGVFGAPGSGKSFVMVETAQSVDPELISDKLEFNLSQFGSLGDLHDALHQVRDVRLEGKIPLVCWDEFDATFEGEELGWLRYFLAPMEDGVFRQGQMNHPIGQAIFVFAGGTSHRMEDFPREGMSADDFRALKGPDFVSRMKGYVNVLGPNPREDEADPRHLLRRAIWLRANSRARSPSALRRAGRAADRQRGPARVPRDRGVRPWGPFDGGPRRGQPPCRRVSFQRSSLPPEAQLDLHVNGREFLSLVQRMDLDSELETERQRLERLARASHEIYCEDLQERGKTSDTLVSWEELPEHYREQSRRAARDIPEKLARIDHVMIPARSHDAPFDFPGEALEGLAEQEHERFVRAKTVEGWSYGDERDEKRKTNPTLVPWEELPEEEREKDRAQVRAIPRILARAGYTVVHASRDADR